MLYLASVAMFFSQVTVAIISHYIGIGVGKWSILSSYGIYLLAFLLCVHAAGRRMLPAHNAIVLLFGLFSAIVLGSSLVTLITAPSAALLRNVCYLLAFAVVPFLLGAAQDRRSLEVLMSTVFYAGTAVALTTLLPSSWTYDSSSYGRPIFLGADFLRLILGPVLGIATLTGFYYAVTARSKTLCAVTLACATVGVVSLYFSVMRMGYYLAVLLLMLMPLHLVLCKRISFGRALVFMGIAICLHLFCKNIFVIIAQWYSLIDWLHRVLAELLSLISIGDGTWDGAKARDRWATSPDAYYGMLTRSHLGDLNWDAIAQQFSRDHLPLIPGQSAIGLTSMFDAYPNDSTVIRVRLYLEAIMMFFAAPVLGMGASTFQQFSFQGPFSFPHSTLLHVAAELGAVGVLVLMLSLATCAWRLLPYTLLLAPYLFFIAIDQTHGSYFSSWGGYFFMGVAASMVPARLRTGIGTDADRGDFRLLVPSWKRPKP